MKIEFTVEFIQWVLTKFKLPIMKTLVKESGWGYDAIIYKWKKTGVPEQLITILQEKLVVQKLMGKVSCEQTLNMEDLFKEYQNLQTN